jgi:Neuraminidase (sialidase)
MTMNNPIARWVALLLGAAPATAAEPELQKTDLFRAGEGGYVVYRIPGLVATKTGTLLAYCEARKDGVADWGRIDVLLRRSTDGGATWSEPRRMAELPPAWEKIPEVREAGGITVNNPLAIADETTGVVHFLYCVEYARCFYVRSDDDGVTFSKPVEITATFKRFRPEYDWKVIATGPGHGIRLQNGRLLVPVWLSTSAKGPHHPSCVATVYSDDGGKTWERGEIVVRPPALADPSEAAVAELSDGRVMLNIRHEGAQRRAVSVSPDGATGWSEPRLDEALPDPVCMASMAQSARGLLFCNLDNGADRERKNLTLKLSRDAGRTWNVLRRIEPARSGYSDLAVGSDGTVYCLYERGKGPGALSLVRLHPPP